MNKRGQTEVITTILLILIVLAAAIIVWQVINRFVTKGSESITSKTACIDVKLDIVKANVSTLSITRMAGGEDDAVKNVTILVKGAKVTVSGVPAPALAQFETDTYSFGSTQTSGDKVEVAPVLKDGTLCDPTESAIITPT